MCGRSTRKRQLRPAVGVALALACASTAAGGHEPIRVEMRAPNGCSSPAEFESQVLWRTHEAQAAAAGQSATLLSVEVKQDVRGMVGTLQVTDRAGNQWSRVVSGSSCQEVVEALSLVAALSIDPSASTAPVPAQTSPIPSASTSVAPPTPPPPRKTRPLPAAPATEPRPPGWQVGMSSGMRSAVSPGIAATVGLHVQWDRERFAPSSPAVRLTLEGAFTGWKDVAPGEARFVLGSVRLDVCPVGWGSWLRFRPCGSGDLGVLSVRGRGVASDGSSSALWGSLGLLGRVGIQVVRGMSMEVDAGVFVPLARPTFGFDNPWTEVWRVPAVGGRAGLGVAVDL